MPSAACGARHFERRAEGFAVFYHASAEPDGLEVHAHAEIQISIPIYEQTSALTRAHELCVIPGHREHRTNWGGGREIVVLHLAPDFVDCALGEGDAMAEKLFPRFLPHEFLIAVGHAIRRLVLRHGALDPFYLSSLATMVAGELFSHQTARTNGTAQRVSPVRVARAMELMHANCGSVSLGEVAAELSMSPWHFSRQFSKEVGISPYQYMLRVRVERANQLIGLGYPISDVAAMTGFTDQSHLNRHFKRILGHTPGNARRAG